MSSKLTHMQNSVMARLLIGGCTSQEIVEATGLPDKSVKTALYALRDIHKKAYIAGHKPVNGRLTNVWAAGNSKDVEYPRVDPAVKAPPKPDREASKARLSAQSYIEKHLQKQHTPFGWLLDNAQAPKRQRVDL